MKYLIRSVKYFIYLLVVLSLIIAILMVAKIVDSDLASLFVNGYDSFWQIALLMAAFAAVYPLFGYGRKDALIPGSDDEVLPVLEKVMTSRGYVKIDDAGAGVWRKKSFADRLIKSFEDKVTVTRTATGFTLEGINKDIVRLCSDLSYRG